jgi:hypothetical protein
VRRVRREFWMGVLLVFVVVVVAGLYVGGTINVDESQLMICRVDHGTFDPPGCGHLDDPDPTGAATYHISDNPSRVPR